MKIHRNTWLGIIMLAMLVDVSNVWALTAARASAQASAKKHNKFFFFGSRPHRPPRPPRPPFCRSKKCIPSPSHHDEDATTNNEI